MKKIIPLVLLLQAIAFAQCPTPDPLYGDPSSPNTLLTLGSVNGNLSNNAYTYSYTFPSSPANLKYKVSMSVVSAKGRAANYYTGPQFKGGGSIAVDIDYVFLPGDVIKLYVPGHPTNPSFSGPNAGQGAYGTGGNGSYGVTLNGSLLMVLGGGGGAQFYVSAAGVITGSAGGDAQVPVPNVVPCVGAGCTGLATAYGGGGAGYLVSGNNATVAASSVPSGGGYTNLTLPGAKGVINGIYPAPTFDYNDGYGGFTGGGAGSGTTTLSPSAAVGGGGGGGGYGGGSGGFINASSNVPSTGGSSYINTLIRQSSNFSTAVSSTSAFPIFIMLCTGTIVLPVTYASFTATKIGRTSMLQWATASESNTVKYIVERSTKNGVWVPAGEVAAAGNSTVNKTYQFTDREPIAGLVNTYRLNQVDFNGTSNYSVLKTIDFGNVKPAIAVFPNPANSVVYVGGPAATVALFDVAGRLVATYIGNGANAVSVPTAHLSAGLYYLHITAQNGQATVEKIQVAH